MSQTGAHADHDRRHYRFEHTQSRDMRAREWENRLPPVQGYIASILSGLGIAVAGCCLLVAMLVFHP